MSFSLVILIALIATAGGVALLVYSFGAKSAQTAPDPEWLSTFSAQRYRPMLRMLAADDYEFLSTSGMDREAVHRLRTERREVFRAYLSNLERDFDRLHGAARTLLFASEIDRPELASRLVRMRIDFQRAVFTTKVGLALDGFLPKTVDVSRLVAAIESVHEDFRSLQPRGFSPQST